MASTKKGLPNLGDLRKTIPPKGLLDPSLRTHSGLQTRFTGKSTPTVSKSKGKRRSKKLF